MGLRLIGSKDLAGQLAQRGLRATRQRIAVLRRLQADKGHPTALEMHARLVPRQPKLSHKTVYEILDALVDVGLARRVTQIGGSARYEARLERHDHAWCCVCGRLFDVASRVDRSVRDWAELPAGFELESIQVTLAGRCARCTAASS